MISDRVKNLPPYIFSEFQKKKTEMQQKGVDIIDLGIGAPDLPTPDFIYDRLVEEAKKPSNHRYSPYSGVAEFREAVADYYSRHYGVTLDPETEVLMLIGSKEGLAHLLQATLNPGDGVILPDPGYPVYAKGVILAGGKTILLPLEAKKGYTPDWGGLAPEEVKQAKLLLLNYPSNPTGATVELNTFQEAVAFAKKHELLLVQDAAYDLITFDGYRAPSVLQVPGAKDYALEFGSLSKSFNMTGWRIGYVVGNRAVIQALATLKSNVDSAQFIPIQLAGAEALQSDLSAVKMHNAIYKERMEKLYHALNDLGLRTEKTRGTIFLWSRVPAGFTSISLANKLLEEAGIIVTPGTAFGRMGEGYVRFSLTVGKGRLDEVINRMKKFDWKDEKK